MSESGIIEGHSQDISGTLFSFLSNPDAIGKLSGILSKYTNASDSTNSPQGEDFSKENDTSDTQSNENIAVSSTSSPTNKNSSNLNLGLDFSKIASILGGNSPEKAQKNKDQITLLLAIRPYLSPRRQELIDSFIKINHIGEILNKIS